MEYQKVLGELKTSINHKGKNDLFLLSVKTLKNDFGQEISTKFLRGLCEKETFKAKTKRISYLLTVNNLKTERRLRFYGDFVLNRYSADIVEYSINRNGEVYIKDSHQEEIGNFFKQNKKEVLFFVTL